MLASNTLKQNLIASIDRLVDDLQAKDQNHDPQVQIEAAIISNGESRKVVLGSFDTRQWQPQDAASLQEGEQAFSPQHEVLPSPSSDSHRDARHSAHTTVDVDDRPRRKAVGGLRLGTYSAGITPPRTPSPQAIRQLESDNRIFPKRRKIDDVPKLRASSLDKLVEGIWEQIHKSHMVEEMSRVQEALSPWDGSLVDFSAISKRCRMVTGASRTARAAEVVMQSHWIDRYDARLEEVEIEHSDLNWNARRRLVLAEACASFEWSEREMRNRMYVWKGYRDIKNAAGWVALVFAGLGIYRFCKYRVGFDDEAMGRLKSLASRFEVAADTIQPHWRHLLSVTGLPSQRVYHGHPYSWVVNLRRKDPMPLAWTYRHMHPNFTFDHIDECEVDFEAWQDDPRRVSVEADHTCTACSKPQSQQAEHNECECFTDLFGPGARRPPVQVFNAEDGRNNGLVACCSFERGSAVGEFVGVITKGLQDVDVMQGEGTQGQYQIYQGRKGNFTRFINHSCQPNAQLQTFTWLGLKRTIIVSKGIPGGREITVDYSSRYWKGLEKKCLCGESACRYRDR